VAESSPSQRGAISLVADCLTRLNRYFADNPESSSTRDPLMLAYWERVLNGLVYELYFPDELHGAGLHLFDLVTQAGVSDLDLDTTLEPDGLKRVRHLFETLQDGANRLRIALDKLQTLDTVRIIEGKA